MIVYLQAYNTRKLYYDNNNNNLNNGNLLFTKTVNMMVHLGFNLKFLVSTDNKETELHKTNI
jgi:hypothetical protein